jgi:hypothetical protein
MIASFDPSFAGRYLIEIYLELRLGQRDALAGFRQLGFSLGSGPVLVITGVPG